MSPGLSIDPPPSRWAELLAGKKSPRIMSGHQAEFWHPGILAKYFAADAASRAFSGSMTWLVVDQDSNDPSRINYPASGPTRATWRIPFRGAASASGFADDTPTGSLPPLAPADLPQNAALPCVAEGLKQISGCLRAHATQPNAAHQFAAATVDLLAPSPPRGGPGRGGQDAPKLQFATDLNNAPLFSDLLEAMRSNPTACINAYNAAVDQVPAAQLRPLDTSKQELPLWRIEPARPRRRVYAKDLATAPQAQLAPKALLMTAIVRAAHCDLFIHGTGGGLYDRATELWFQSWQPHLKLAPTAIVTATLFLPFDGPPQPSPEQIAKAIWQSHHNAHDPGALGDPGAAHRKQNLLQSLRTARSRGEDPADSFRQLHKLLDETRAKHSQAIAYYRSEAAKARTARAQSQVIFDRTWPFPLYPAESLQSLRSDIDSLFDSMP